MEIITRNEKILYIGIDVHKDTYSLCCFDFHKNELSDEMTVKATTKAVFHQVLMFSIYFLYFICAPTGQTHVKIFCFKSLNYYLKNAQNGKIPLGWNYAFKRKSGRNRRF